jgi:hypothetical protein
MVFPNRAQAGGLMPSIEERLAMLEKWKQASDPALRRSLRIVNALEGRPGDATLSLPHNDSWLFEDNVDSTHPANLRYVVSSNVTKVVNARLSIKLAPYRTYDNFSATTTSAGTAHLHPHTGTHLHPHTGTHPHTIPIDAGPFVNAVGQNAAGGNLADAFGPTTAPVNAGAPGNTDAAAPGNTDNESAHTHPISVTSTLGVTEGTTATGVTISFDGVDKTVALGGPFNADQVELNVFPYLITTSSVWHVIAMQPSGLGRIEAHLRLGVYVSAGQVI